MQTATTKAISIAWQDEALEYEDALRLLDAAKDFGLYQIYGSHPVYGDDVLLYIGIALRQTFGARMKQHSWITYERDHLRLHPRLSVRVGRLDESTYLPASVDPRWTDWASQLTDAERLLIYMHTPAYNSRNIAQPPNLEGVNGGNDTVVVFNRGGYGSLQAKCAWPIGPHPVADRE